MKRSGIREFEERARIMKALGHATRLFLVDELARGERCVHDLTKLVGADMSTVSKHLAVLRSAGIVTDEKRGAQVYYRLTTPCVLRFFDCVEAVLKPGPKTRPRPEIEVSSRNAVTASRRG